MKGDSGHGSYANTVFAQLLKIINRHEFQPLHVGPYRPPREYRALSQWSQFTVMMFAQITGRASLRGICDSVFSWAKFRSTKGGVKLHALLDHDGYIPKFAAITDAKTFVLAFARTEL